jgi:hypothetical protein
MPNDDRGTLRIYGTGDVSARQVSDYLRSVVFAYESLIAFEVVIGQYERLSRAFDRYGPWPIPPKDYWLTALAPARSVIPSAAEVSAFVAPRNRLRIQSVTLSSPGFWEFVGKLNPLEVIRQYLSDRHERRKDREYREEAEKERLHLENQLLENRVIRERVQLAREVGATDDDLTPLMNVLVGKPLSKLAQFQDHNVIEGAEIVAAKELPE